MRLRMSHRSLDIDHVACKMLASQVLHGIPDRVARNAYTSCTLEALDHVIMMSFISFVLIGA